MIYLYSKNKTPSIIGREKSWAWSWQVICNICDLLFRLKINTYYCTRSPLCLLLEAFLSPFTLAAFLDRLPEVLVLSFLFSKQAENGNLPFKRPGAVAFCCHLVLLLKLDSVSPFLLLSCEALNGPEACTDFTGAAWGFLKAIRVHLLRTALVSPFRVILPGL